MTSGGAGAIGAAGAGEGAGSAIGAVAGCELAGAVVGVASGEASCVVARRRFAFSDAAAIFRTVSSSSPSAIFCTASFGTSRYAVADTANNRVSHSGSSFISAHAFLSAVMTANR
jgi:hypothetical protein